jgi:hypothetical protein
MSSRNHHLRLFWAPEKAAPSLRQQGIDTNDPADVLSYQDEVTAVENLREALRLDAQSATGAIHDLPQVEGAPQLIEKPWTSTEADSRYVAWNVFAVDSQGVEHQLSKRLLNIDGGVMWLEPIRAASVARITPPEENIAAGVRCEDCRRFSLQQGQEWLNQTTHRFEGAQSAMWRDVVALVAEHQDVEAPNSLEDFGACLEDSKLVLRDHPGCTKYSPRGLKGPRTCQAGRALGESGG